MRSTEKGLAYIEGVIKGQKYLLFPNAYKQGDEEDFFVVDGFDVDTLFNQANEDFVRSKQKRPLV